MFSEGFFSYMFFKLSKVFSGASSMIKKYSILALVVITIVGVFTLISHVSEIASYFGVQTRAQLKEELLVKKQDLEEATKVAKALELSVIKEAEANKVLDEVISEKIDDQSKLDNKIEEVVTKHKASTEKVVVNKKVNKTKYTKQEMDDVAKANIDAIWVAYDAVKNS